MTVTQPIVNDTNDGVVPPESPEEIRNDLVVKAANAVLGGKLSLADLYGLVTRPAVGPAEPEVKKPPAITEDQRAALAALPQVYGVVAPEERRVLSESELALLVRERDTIDTILGLIKARKDESIREALANHLDLTYSPKPTDPEPPVDSKGHLAVKQAQSVPGTGRKIARSVSGGKPVLTIEAVEALHAEGKIDRATYLKITRKPDTPRVLDEDGLAKAIKGNPELLWILGERTTRTPVTTAITVTNDR